MADNFAAWPAMTDDDGSLTLGTVPTKAMFDEIRASLADNVYSVTNPTIKTKTIIDEVVTARGSKASLTARIDVALNADGTPKAVAGQATETQVGKAQGQRNLARNPDMERWSLGGSAAPDEWTLGGAGAAVARAGPAMGDTTVLDVGTYCAKITSGGGAAATLSQNAISVANLSRWGNVKGRKVAVVCRGKASVANVLRITVADGVTSTSSSYHAGDGVNRAITVLHTISNTATYLAVTVEVALGANVGYVGGFGVVFSDVISPDWVVASETTPTQALVGNAPILVNLGGVVNSQVNDAASSGTGETDAHSYTLPANTLKADGDFLVIRGSGTFTSNANTKTIKLYFGGTSTTLASNAASAATEFDYTVTVTRRSSSAVLVSCVISYTNTITGLPVRATIGGLDFTTTKAIKSTLQFATAGTITEERFSITYFPAP